MKKKILMLFLGTFLLAAQAIAQQIMVSGKVTSSEDGFPLPGVLVKIKGSNTLVQTGPNGTYSIRANPQNILVFNYLGTLSEERTIGTLRVIDVALKADAMSLNEVVVTAFGVKQELRSLGFSTQNVKSKEIVDSKQPNLVNALQGKVAGVQITNSSGSAGSSSHIMIRGGSSLSGNNQPLFVVDGIPIDNSTPVGQGGMVAASIGQVGQTASTAPASNRAIDINPEDIESVTVLKGPAAAALYGIRAASGAIVITTKKGTGGAAKISYQNNFSVDNVNKLPTIQGKFKQGEQGVFNATASDSWGPEFSSSDQIYDNLGNFFKNAFTQSHDLSVSGSSEQTRYYTSASIFDQGSIVDNSDFKRKSFRLNADTKIGEKLTVGGSANYVRSDRNYVPQGSANGVMGALFWPRNDDMKNYLNANGTQRIFNPADNDNPYWTIRNKPLINNINRIIAIGNIDYNPYSFLNITYRLGTDYFGETFKSIRMPGTLETSAIRGAIAQSTGNNQITTSTVIVTGKKTIAKDFKFSLALGQNLESATNQTTTSSAIRFIDPTFPSINNTVAADRTVSENLNRRRIFGLFGDFAVDWKSIAYLNLRARNDWSSTLPVTDNSFFYPSVSGAVIFTDLLKEWGMKSNDNTFSYGKIRAAYSEVGKDAPPHVTSTSLGSVTNTFTINPRGFITNANNPFGNPTLVPEFTRAFEIGTDLRFIKNRFGIDLTYYKSKSSNQILATRVPPSAGAFLTYLNGGSIKNEGVEIVFNAQAIVNPNFKWSIDVNFARNTSIVKALPGTLNRIELSDASVVGNVAQAAAFLNGSLFGINGNVWKRNANNELLLGNDGYPQVQTALTNIGDRNPDFNSGITNTFTYKNLNLAFMVDVRIGGKVFNASENSLVRSGLSLKTLDRGNRVFDGIIESTGMKNTISVPLNQNYYQSIYANQGYDFVEDGGWYRLRYVTLSYNMPVKFLDIMKVKSLSFTATGRNLILITNYSGVDPEVSGSGAGVGGSGSFGFDNLGVPATRGVDLGLRLTF
ncbi:SusC/RagA family TonB-linked outer membrane protein [Daejeonella sp.]|uniref:SusC/RagA family TonB-linked outer membrane protein n=1 Tax=Daejeonella sp. TaxID=2805397 RepID=UPI0039839687